MLHEYYPEIEKAKSYYIEHNVNHSLIVLTGI
jgi:hypothetical protein